MRLQFIQSKNKDESGLVVVNVTPCNRIKYLRDLNKTFFISQMLGAETVAFFNATSFYEEAVKG
jgi:hypothetical protein